jgi:hypothetical protein
MLFVKIVHCCLGCNFFVYNKIVVYISNVANDCLAFQGMFYYLLI